MIEHWIDANPSLHLIEEGEGAAPIVLIHEVGGSAESWAPAAGILSARHRTVRYDQRGFGWSDRSCGDFSHEASIADLSAVMDHVSPADPAVLAACAGGCAVAVGYALRHPNRVRSLVLCSPALEIDSSAAEKARARAALVEAEGMHAIADAALKATFPASFSGERLAAYRGRFLSNDPRAFAKANIALSETVVELENLSIPALLLAGEHDVRPVGTIRGWAGRIPLAEVSVVPGAGHIMHVQMPVEVASHISAFAIRHGG